ncbi:MAG: hypothetical protein ACYC61_21555, partial [Isosphaeraceae bacterium]
LIAALTACSLLAPGASRARAQVAEKADTGSARVAIDRGLAFLKADAAKWREEHSCASCHHGTMTVWALSEAKARGYEVSDTLAEMTKWTKDRLANIDKPRDTRPGWNMVNTPAVYLALMAEALPTQDALTPADLRGIAGHLVRHQEADGSWAWSLAPAANRPPPVFESDEVVTLMAETVLGSRARPGPDGTSPTREAIASATAWLNANSKPGPSTQATAVRLFRDVRADVPPEERWRGVERLLALQNEDGGWGQMDELPSDAYATGQALYFLSLAGVERDRAEVRKGVAYLIATQKPDGSWPMTSRAQPGAKPFKSPVPITYFGSAWATLGLLRSTTK